MRVVYGLNPVRELLRAGGQEVAELWFADGGERSRAVAEIERLAAGTGAKVRRAPRARLDRLAGLPGHQGVVAVVGDYRYAELGDVLEAARRREEPPLVVLLDGVEDPQNLGAIARSAHALGAHGLVIPRDRAAGVTPAAAKASAGAVEHLAVVRVTNLARTVEELKEDGVWAVAADAGGDRDLAEVDLRGPIALVVGGEGRGVRDLVRRTCDHVARIPMAGRVGSLNASVAAGIALYEASRQRRESSKTKMT
ncbi:MAG TPA: 23S rRNA (guanosine(2251)-2'-O)-methyltransferase RlmB [Anaeromyxobacteraceae bacterium]|nr:23S rRNA (guanosine(2251)-2'-O)-methyltransferase RlmB [Anaeromyxobacteraceae bacterium]